MRTWDGMRSSIADRLARQTGHDIAWWTDQIEQRSGARDESSLRSWLQDQGVTGYQQMLLVMERYGYPDFLLASADDLLFAQYSDRAALRPILAAVVAATATFGPVEIQARKTYTCLLTPRRTFAAIRPTTRTRVDLALRLDGMAPSGRLHDGRNTAGGTLNLRLPLSSVEDFDDEALAILRMAYDHNR